MSDPVTILFATVTGNAEDCAERIARHLTQGGIETRIENLADYSAERLASEKVALFVVSTWGDGEPPDDVLPFWYGLQDLPAGALSHLRYALYALGDQSYEIFCGFGKDCDSRLSGLGARRILPPELCDFDWEAPLEAWRSRLREALVIS